MRFASLIAALPLASLLAVGSSANSQDAPTYRDTRQYILSACKAGEPVSYYDPSWHAYENGKAIPSRIYIDRNEDTGVISLSLMAGTQAARRQCKRYDKRTTDVNQRYQHPALVIDDIRMVEFNESYDGRFLTVQCVDRNNPTGKPCMRVENREKHCLSRHQLRRNPTYLSFNNCSKPGNVVRAFENLQDMSGGRFEPKADPFDAPN